MDDEDDLIEEESGDHSILVPLEFSGGETRVLTDPDEIKEIQCHEMERYYHRKYVRKYSKILSQDTKRAWINSRLSRSFTARGSVKGGPPRV